MLLVIPRWVPLLLSGAGVYAGWQLGVPVLHETVDSVKSVLTRYELGNLAEHMMTDSAAGFALPPADDAEAFARYLHREAHAGMGRDVASDLWGHAYRLEPGERGALFLVRSDGANGRRDACVEPNGHAAERALDSLAALEAAQAREVTAAAPGDSTATEPAPSEIALPAYQAPLVDDDVCAVVHEVR